jgi:hypothetical protein
LVGGIALVLVVLTLVNLRYCRQNPGGNDFLVHWVGTRAFLTEGISPYSDEAALRIQTLAYGRAAKPGEHELRVAYPLYSIILFFPFALIKDFATARAVWMTVLEISLVLLAFLSIRIARWKPRISTWAFFLLFSVLWYHSIRPLINGNAVILIALMVAGAIISIRSGVDELAGILLGLSTIKPQLTVLLVVYILIWGAVTRRWKLVAWTSGTVFLLSAAAGLLMPDWILQNLREVLRYPGYNPPGTLQAALGVWLPAMGQKIGNGISIVLAVILLAEWWIFRKAEFRGFFWTCCLTLTVSQWIGIQTDPGNFIILLPGVTLVFSVLEERWRRFGNIVTWGSMVLLLVGIWALFIKTLEPGSQPQQSPIMFLPLPAFLLLTLYWVRWWAVKPPSVWFDWVNEQEFKKLL